MLCALCLVMVPVAFVSAQERSVPPVFEPTVFSLAGTKFSTVKLISANQLLPNARIQADLIDSPDDALDAKVNASVQQKISAFTRALPAYPATTGFYHQLRIMPHIDYSAGKAGSITLQIDEYHPVGAVTSRYESWTAAGDRVEQPLLDDQLADQIASHLQIPAHDLKQHVGKPLAIGFLPNFKARIYGDGVLAAYVRQPYVDVPLTQLPDAARRYKRSYYANYPFRPDTYTQKMLDKGYQNALTRAQQPPDCDRESCVALTFDDGPDSDITPIILKTLADEQVKATFFVQGNQVQKSPAAVRQIAEAGHEVENHTFAHPDLVKLHRADLIRKQIDDTQAALAANGIQAKFLRPPYGSIDETVKKVVDMPIILWNVDSQEWRPGASSQAIADSIVSQTRPGSIILLHDTRRISAEALPLVIAQLKARGFRFMTVAGLLQIDGTARGVFASR